MKKQIKLLLVFLGFITALSAEAAGGEGAKSCSREFKILGIGWAVSVECEEGYYAKCGIFNAKCVKADSEAQE
ncbi:MAG: hypothetical protein N2044_06505 [Cyclobacteriaceae bacterium]|nr:hypothetical protein [Cyclobacteriaceae bacterium]MCX7637483.1 hypothetical protein [Cyclobacteriaceae bacterium]MDW8331664.1 hypothetical protein [Cyclobacteriaceae bacterium]